MRVAELLEVLLFRDVPEARTFCINLVSSPHSRGGQQRGSSGRCNGPYRSFRRSSTWSTIWPVIRRTRSFSGEVITSLAYRDRHAGFIRKIGEAAAADFYTWLVCQYPFEEDPRIQGLHEVSNREQVGRFRDSVLLQLQSWGTTESRKAVERIATVFPGLTWMKWMAAKATLETLRQSWVPPTPTSLLAMAREPKLRIVQSGSHLLSVLIESLERLESELQGETPGVPDLWKPRFERVPSSPKVKTTYMIILFAISGVISKTER